MHTRSIRWWTYVHTRISWCCLAWRRVQNTRCVSWQSSWLAARSKVSCDREQSSIGQWYCTCVRSIILESNFQINVEIRMKFHVFLTRDCSMWSLCRVFVLACFICTQSQFCIAISLLAIYYSNQLRRNQWEIYICCSIMYFVYVFLKKFIVFFFFVYCRWLLLATVLHVGHRKSQISDCQLD